MKTLWYRDEVYQKLSRNKASVEARMKRRGIDPSLLETVINDEKARLFIWQAMRNQEYAYMKKNRLHLLNTVGDSCELCGSKDKIHFHHISYDFRIPFLKRLLPVCEICHMELHPHLKRLIKKSTGNGGVLLREGG